MLEGANMKILIIDNHTLFRDGLRYLLQQSPRGFDEIIETGSFAEGLQLTAQNPDLDLVLLEIKSPGCNGSISVEYFYRQHPHIPLVVVSSEEYGRVINDALSKGASGFVCKSSTSAILLGALMHVIAGGIYIPQQVLPQTGITYMHRDGCVDERYANSTASRLTPRQLQVLNYLAEGLSNKEIARATSLAEGTVKVHVASVFQALRVNNRTQARQVAEELGLIGPLLAVALV
jgi:DNA-binding NarL/FixJ family response regulator